MMFTGNGAVRDWSNCVMYAESEFWIGRKREALSLEERAEVMAFWTDYVRHGVIKRYIRGGTRVKQRLIFLCVELMMTLMKMY